jgi:thioredoxin 1
MSTLLLKQDFHGTLIKAKKLCLVQFKTEWSGTCQIMHPVYEELAKYYRRSADFFWVDADQEKNLLAQYGIKEVPTILFFKGNELVDCVSGLVSKNKLIAKIENAL